MLNIDELIKGKELPMDYDELIILAGEIEREVLSKVIPEQEDYKKLLGLVKSTNWDLIHKVLEYVISLNLEPMPVHKQEPEDRR